MENLSEERKNQIRIAALVFPIVIITAWISDIGEDDIAIAGLGGFVAAIVTLALAFLLRNRSFKVQMISAAVFSVILLAALAITVRLPPYLMKNKLKGRWESVPAEGGRDEEPMALRFADDDSVIVELGPSKMLTWAYNITTDRDLVLTRDETEVRFKILTMEEKKMELNDKMETLTFVRTE